MDAHHYLGFRCLFGGGVRHMAVSADGRWLALAGWQCGAFKVKARDAWIGWAPEQRFRRLRLVANNTRFLILRGRRHRPRRQVRAAQPPRRADEDRMFVAAVEHGSGVVRGQVGSDGAGGEILGVRRLSRGLGVEGRVVTADALRTCPNTARLIVDGGGGWIL